MIEKYTLLQKCSTSRGALRINCTHKNGQEEKEESKKQDKSGF